MDWPVIFGRAALIAALSTPALGEDASSLKLLGVAIGPGTREAVLAEPNDGRRTITVQDSASVGGFTVRIVDAETVELVAPSGVQTLVLEDRAGPSGPEVSVPPATPPPQALVENAVKQGGALIGSLAIERDACARAGRLPGVRADAEPRLRQVIGVIANLPGRQDGDIRRNAPTKLIAFALSAGLDEALARSHAYVPDVATCRDLEPRWKQAAGRYGLS